MGRTAHVAEVIVTQCKCAGCFPVVRCIHFRVGTYCFAACYAIGTQGIQMFMGWILSQGIRAFLSCKLAVRPRKTREEIVKGMILLNEEDNIFDAIRVKRG